METFGLAEAGSATIQETMPTLCGSFGQKVRIVRLREISRLVGQLLQSVNQVRSSIRCQEYQTSHQSHHHSKPSNNHSIKTDHQDRSSRQIIK